MSKMLKVLQNRDLFAGMMIYEDDLVAAVLSRKPVSIAHVIVFPKAQRTIMEQMSDDEISRIFSVANVISRGMFESLNIHGTNIYVENGVAAGQEEPHFSVHIIARLQDDQLPLDWKAEKMSEEELSSVEMRYKQFTADVVYQKKKQKKHVEKKVDEEFESLTNGDDEEEENLLIKYYTKTP